jgi:hypothetical protein
MAAALSVGKAACFSLHPTAVEKAGSFFYGPRQSFGLEVPSMELRDALTQISEIRRQVARTEVFRGYKSLPVAFSGALAVAAAVFQEFWIPDPSKAIGAYLTLWLGAALVSALAAGVEMALRYWRTDSAIHRDITWLALEQFLPAIFAGGLLTLVLALSAPESLWLLPGLWQILFSLGIFASYRLLPRATWSVALFYMITGILCVSFARDQYALSPWVMGVPFGLGQLCAAAVLYWTLERTHVEQE